MITVHQLLSKARSLLGTQQYSPTHKALVDGYNAVLPRPRGYKVSYQDPWCDVFVTQVFDRLDAADLIGRECGVQHHVQLFKDRGIWLGKQYPKAGDIVVFDWQANGWADHIGLVDQVDGYKIRTLEGNSQGRVAQNNFVWNDWRIVGYARPRYQEAPAQGLVPTPIREEKTEDSFTLTLTYRGITLPAAYLKQVLDLAIRYHINPEFLVVMLHYESLWGQSPVGRRDKNWAGLTYSQPNGLDPAIPKSQGSPRPKSEGGYYIRYETVEDCLADWVYLLDNRYQVQGPKRFKDSVKGLFKAGGAPYDYAAIGYSKYLRGMEARRAGILAGQERVFWALWRLWDQGDDSLAPQAAAMNLDSLAQEVIQGLWDNGPARIHKLQAAGHDPQTVQDRVNQVLKAS